MAIDVLIRLLSQGGDKVKGDLKGVATGAQGVDKELSKVGANQGLNKAGFDAQALTGKLETVRNAAAGIAVVGGAGLLLANNLSEAFIEADRLGGKLESLMKGKGLESGIDQVKALGNEIAALTGGDDDEVASAIAGAIASGRVAGLRQYGIAISAAGMEAIEAAGKISEQAKSQEILNQVLIAGKAAAENLREGMDDSTAALGELDVRWGNLEEGFGKGATQVRAALYRGILSPIMDILEASPGLQQTVGAVLTIGSAALSAGGSVIALASQVGMTMMAFPGLAAAGVSAFGAIGSAAAAAGVAIYAAIAPILPLVLAIAAVMAAITAGAVYLQKRAQAQAEAEGEATDREFYNTVSEKSGGARPGESFEDWRKRTGRTPDQMNADDTGDPAAVNAAIENAQKQATAFQNSAAPQSPTVAAIQASASMPPIVAANTPALNTGSSTGGSSTLQVNAQTSLSTNAVGQKILKIIVPDVLISDGGFRQSAASYAK